MRRTHLFVLAFFVACGGKAIIDPPLQEGSGGNPSSTTTTTVANATTNGPATVTTTITTGPPSDCEVACTDLYQCGLVSDGGDPLCPGFTGDDEELAAFLYGGGGSGGCLQACRQTPLVIDLVDPFDCPGTISNFKGVSAEFADICDNGF